MSLAPDSRVASFYFAVATTGAVFGSFGFGKRLIGETVGDVLLR